MTKKSELPSYLLEKTPWEKDTDPIWLATSFVLQRNLSSFNFPSKLATQEFEKTLDVIKNALFKLKELEKPLLLRAEEISALDKEFLYEHFLCQDSFQNTLAGQGFIIDETTRFLALINVQDHLQLQLLDWKLESEKSYERIFKLEADLNSVLDFAYSPRFGYLTSDSAHSGTALIASIYLHVPALIHTKQLEEALIKQKPEELIASSIEGPLEELIGDLLILQNAYTLGVTEENILHSLQTSALKLMTSEKTIRSHLKKEDNIALKDEIARSYGLLIHSYQLQTKEALNALSLLKLGLDLEWVEGITDNQINELYFQCRHAHLSHLFKEKAIDPQVLSKKRAEYLHQKMQGVKLKI
jgi:protein arginine kinase